MRHRSSTNPAFPFQIAVHSIQRSKELVLRFSMRLFGAVAASAAVLALGAGGASAAPATWNGISGSQAAKLSGSLSVTWVGQSTTCTIGSAEMASNSFASFPSQGVLLGGGEGPGGSLVRNCTGTDPFWNRLFSMPHILVASVNAGAYSVTNTMVGVSGMHPFQNYNGYQTAAYTVPFTNGTALVPSKVTFANTVIGNAGGSQLRATGTLNVTRADGSLLKLN